MRSNKQPNKMRFLAVIMLCGTMTAAADTVNRSFDVGRTGKLIIETDIGAVEVQAGASKRVEITVERLGARGEELELDFLQDGSEIRIVGELPDDEHNRSHREFKIRFEVSLPKKFDVDIETRGGSISVADLDGEVRAKTAGGRLVFGNMDGPVWGKTSGGSIKLVGSRGDADLDTSGGSIKLGDVDGKVRARTSGGSIQVGRVGGSVDARTSGGSIQVDQAGGAVDLSTSGGSVTAYISEQPSADSRLSTSGGSVTAYLAENVRVNLDASTGSGKVHSDFPVEGGRKTKATLRGKINGGGPELYLHSSGGSVNVRKKE